MKLQLISTFLCGDYSQSLKESSKKKLLFFANFIEHGFPLMRFFFFFFCKGEQEILDRRYDLRINSVENTHVHFKANVN